VHYRRRLLIRSTTMSTFRNFAVVALAGLLAAPLSAQLNPGGTTQDRIEAARRRAETVRSRSASDSDARRSGRASSRIPPGHLPPKGMCRVWIDGVAPGQQPPVTDCVTAERTRTVNSRVIYGDRESFPGKGKGKFKNAENRDRRSAERCSVRDGVVVGGRVINVCRDSTLQHDRRGRSDHTVFNDDDDDRGKSEKLSKSEKQARKEARKGGRGRGK